MSQEAGGADLHAHTTASDGVLEPDLLVAAAVAAGLEAVAITDHDTVEGARMATATDPPGGLDVVAGVELSTRARDREVHLLGLFIDTESSALEALTAAARKARQERAETIVDRARKLRLPLDMRRVERIADGAPIGRPHVAAALIEAEVVADHRAAFRRFLGIGRPLFVHKRLPAIEEAITAIHTAGGAAVVAHPGSSRVRDRLLSQLAAAGLDGVEVRHPTHGRHRERLLTDSCRRLGLLPSGGSDFHGPGRGTSVLGQYRVGLDWYRALRDRARERRTTAAKEFPDEYQAR